MVNLVKNQPDNILTYLLTYLLSFSLQLYELYKLSNYFINDNKNIHIQSFSGKYIPAFR